MGGKAKALPDGHPRRMADAKNAWRKMDSGQREAFLVWICTGGGIPPDVKATPGSDTDVVLSRALALWERN